MRTAGLRKKARSHMNGGAISRQRNLQFILRQETSCAAPRFDRADWPPPKRLTGLPLHEHVLNDCFLDTLRIQSAS